MVDSAAVPGRPRSRDAAGLPAVTPERIVSAALELTAQHGLGSWTLRQLAAAVQAYPAVVYHHVGDREAVVSAVVDRVLGMYPLPPEDLHWREWFQRLFQELRAVLIRYPGVARRLAVCGPTVSAAAPTVDRGMRVLQAAGFGDESAPVYRFLSNVACLLVSIEDEQRPHPDAVARISEAWSEYRDQPERPGLAAMGASVYEETADPLRRASYFAGFFDYSMQRCLDGVAARLGAISRR
ncbi:TetR/AcrR family transcriptional regulator [Amycolatopsis rhizosphaerae]|uniref:TetR/AcrR family transcriptional regulator n=1 Tax=Amycolatopsis rhizosphaerae TaxID=2053003 RepID=A0A558BBW8_9PSEU|nr:TetR family transcriptional regulator [Amycolatopsis rhizosphaerae]TVT34001.1 TetR/AcrR family transcriptional regulator [Amycolatopsis rhizosphaerae]